MKKSCARLMFVCMLALVGGSFIAMPALAQDPAPESETILGVQVDPVMILAIVAIVGGGIVSVIVQFVKKKIAFINQGVGAFLFTAVLSYGVTAAWFLGLHPMRPWLWPTFAVYGLCVVGEATGAFHLIKKITKTPSTPAA